MRPTMIAADQILEQFRLYPTSVQSATQLAINLGLPYPTIRRAVQDLRRDGFLVPYNRALGGYTFEGVVGN